MAIPAIITVIVLGGIFNKHIKGENNNGITDMNILQCINNVYTINLYIF